MSESSGKYATAESRWAGVGPYYAMFPATFADHVIRKYTFKGETVLDPFSGRGTAVFSAASTGRNGIGIEVNPVGWVYSQAKLHAAAKDEVVQRLRDIGHLANRFWRTSHLPPFFSCCFTKSVLSFLLAARQHLNWRRDPVDWTLMALLLVNLHGKRDASLSNQMRQTKSMSPEYAIKWWKAHELQPPDVEPVKFMGSSPVSVGQ